MLSSVFIFYNCYYTSRSLISLCLNGMYCDITKYGHIVQAKGFYLLVSWIKIFVEDFHVDMLIV